MKPPHTRSVQSACELDQKRNVSRLGAPRTGTGKKTPGGAGTHTEHGRTRAHRITQTNLKTTYRTVLYQVSFAKLKC